MYHRIILTKTLWLPSLDSPSTFNIYDNAAAHNLQAIGVLVCCLHVLFALKLNKCVSFVLALGIFYDSDLKR